MIPLHVVTREQWKSWLAAQPTPAALWLKGLWGDKPPIGQSTAVAGADGRVAFAVTVAGEKPSLWTLGDAAQQLPALDYKLEKGSWKKADLLKLKRGWDLGSYRFTRYKKPVRELATLSVPGLAKGDAVAEAVFLARDLINTPPADMMPRHLAEIARKIARPHKASVSMIKGDALLEKGYNAIHTVGRASAEAPHLIDLRWGNAKHPKVTIVGKGVCFDTGGLDIKPSSGMKLMKKDMGGAAMALGLAHLVMSDKLPVRLRVLVPAVENAISGNAYRTSDVIHTRKGITVEVGNTDAEGRLILCDALAEADSEKPEVIIDIATLTGAARVALGTEMPALFCSDDALAQEICRVSREVEDPMWPMPLWQEYRPRLASTVADLHSTGDDGTGGAILAALFLQSFVEHAKIWMHVDTMAWNQSGRPGRPKGGEAMGMRAIYAWLGQRFGR
jgi:leucyl aminopeptidase